MEITIYAGFNSSVRWKASYEFHIVYDKRTLSVQQFAKTGEVTEFELPLELDSCPLLDLEGMIITTDTHFILAWFYLCFILLLYVGVNVVVVVVVVLSPLDISNAQEPPWL